MPMNVQNMRYWAWIITILGVFFHGTLLAQERNFSPRFTANDTGDIVFVGNTLMTLTNSNPQTVKNVQDRVTTGTNANNNTYFMNYVNVDPLSFAYNSSEATLNLPPGSTVLWAGLYWGANIRVAGNGSPSLNGAPASKSRIKFRPPNVATPLVLTNDVTTNEIALSGDATNYGTPYSSFVDITGIVKSAGNGKYTAGEVLAATGYNRYAVWTMVVVYRAPGLAPKNLTVFDGFKIIGAAVAGGGTISTLNIPISGFIAPPSGPVEVKLGVMSYEGDEGYNGDALKIGPTTSSLYNVSDAYNPSNNFANSTFAYLGAHAASPAPGFPSDPTYKNLLGVDADIMLAPPNAVLNNGTSAVVQFTTNLDAYYPAVLTTAINLYAPQVKAKKEFLDVNGDNVTPGDVITYTIEFENRPETEVNGDATRDTVLEDILPEEVSYVPGTLKVVRVGTTTPVDLTDAGDSDEGEIVPVTVGGVSREKIVVRLGHPYDPPNHNGGGSPGGVGTTGGIVKQGEKAIITFDVRVKLGIKDGVQIVNEANIGYNSLARGIAFVASVVPAVVNNSKVISGVVFEDLHYGGGAGRGPLNAPTQGPAGTLPFPADAKPVPGARVELYGPQEGAGQGAPSTLLDVTTTDADGIYTFTDINNTGPDFDARDYMVRVVTDSVKSTRNAATGLLPVLTYSTTTQLTTNSFGDQVAEVIPVTDKVGGENPAGADVGAQMNIGQPMPPGAQNVAHVKVTGADLLRVDFGFNFDTVVNNNASGQGSLAQVITNANLLTGDATLQQENHPAGVENVIFNFPAGTSFPVTIATGATPLPTITQRLYLDASIQNGVADPAGQPPRVYLDGTGTSGTTGRGLFFHTNEASNSLVKNFAIGNFSASGIEFMNSNGHQVKGNYIGLTPSQAQAGNRGRGILFSASTDTRIGGSNPGDPNIIAYNGTSNEGGIFIANGARNTISRNSIFRNKGLGIDRSPVGVNGNDGIFYPNGGDNEGVDYPVFTSINLSTGAVTGHVGRSSGNTANYSGAIVEVFVADDDGDQNGPVYVNDGLSIPHGEGRTFLPSSITVAADGSFTGTVTLNGNTGALTATATYNNSTSEFGPNESLGTTLSGVVYEDLNLNNQYDTTPTPEPGPGTDHPLFAKLIDETNAAVAVQTVAVNPTTGAYSFSGIVPGTYTVVISLNGDDTSNVTPSYPPGWSGLERPTGQESGMSIQSTPITNFNFGFTRQSTLTGRVFVDTGVSAQIGTANNGRLDTGETGIGGIQITLLVNGTPEGTPVSTNPDGTFSIALPPGLAENAVVSLVQSEHPNHLSTLVGRAVIGSEPARTGDRSTRTLSFNYKPGVPYEGFDFGNVPLPALDTDGQQNGLPGTIIFFPHTFTAPSDGVVTFSTTALSDPNTIQGWIETLYRDQNDTGGGPIGDGVFTPGEDLDLAGPITVTAGQQIRILVREFIPHEAPNDARNAITVTADFTYTDNTGITPVLPPLQAQVQRTDLAIVGDSALQLVKKVDKQQAKPGEEITYTLVYLNNGPTPISSVIIHDTTPAFTTFVSSVWNVVPPPAGITITLDGPNAGESGPLKWTFDNSLPPGGTGEINFKVKVIGNEP